MHNPSAKNIDGKEMLQDISILKLSSYDLRKEEVILPCSPAPQEKEMVWRWGTYLVLFISEVVGMLSLLNLENFGMLM